jgi:hypothetical protein
MDIPTLPPSFAEEKKALLSFIHNNVPEPLCELLYGDQFSVKIGNNLCVLVQVRAFSAAPKRVAQFKPMVPNLIGRNAQLAGVLYSQAEAKGTQANVGASLDSLNAIVSEGVWATKVEEVRILLCELLFKSLNDFH